MYKDLNKRRKWQREYYQAKKKKLTVRQQLIQENEKLKLENNELRKKIVLSICPQCKKTTEKTKKSEIES
jgi:regulator of replication initiation timing